ncbi:MAG TPA: tRNA lysidine(34) synthetase TilS [Acidobacteriaceae bacterium]|jgi:tRNA(Ile)-lysidine synthase|nr:tRNA lysidine(34) synthetase TilS [Acidobacteriaceae bacterium]
MTMKTGLAMDRGLVRAGERVCVAVSGGADSVALLLAMVEANTESKLNKEPLGVVLRAAHVHHGLRGAEADGDEEFVREVCERLGVPLTVFRVDTAARQAAEGEGVEEAARELRYEALRGLMAGGVVDVVATAHTLDDQAETVVMKMLRGAWTEGLGGISPVLECTGPVETHVSEAKHGAPAPSQPQGRIVRPLLGVRRVEVEAFLRERGQGWRDDATNQDVSLTRNRVRHLLMPMLREFNPALDTLLARTADVAREEEAYWQAEVARVLPQVLLPGKPVRGGGRAVSTAVGEVGYALEIERLRAMPAALRRRLVRAAARKVFADAKEAYVLGGEETAKVLALAGFGGAGGAVTGKIGSRLELHGGLRVERSAREIRVWRQG